MPFSLDPQTMRAIIMDHYEYPRNKRVSNTAKYQKVHMDSESCVDDIYVEMLLEDGTIQDLCFDGVACTIATSSTSIMTELLIGKTVEEAKVIMQNYFNMIDEKEYDEELLEEANVFKNTGKQANRIKCATIGWNAVKEMLGE